MSQTNDPRPLAERALHLAAWLDAVIEHEDDEDNRSGFIACAKVLRALAAEPAQVGTRERHGWQIEHGVECVVCPYCTFTFAASHENEKGGYSCPNCPSPGVTGAIGGKVCSHGVGVLVTHVSDGLPCSDYLLAASAEQQRTVERYSTPREVAHRLAELMEAAAPEGSPAPEPRTPSERETLADRLWTAFINVQFDHTLSPRDWLLDLLAEAATALRTPSQPAGPTREQVAQIIESTLGYTNGWRVTDEQYREDCLAAADQILGFGDAAPQEEG